jgi:hypothetical protein
VPSADEAFVEELLCSIDLGGLSLPNDAAPSTKVGPRRRRA